jgi:NADPH-dependent ferric siderophore reductase
MSEQQAVERPARPAPVRRTVPVRRVEDIGPHLRRVTFGGPELAGFETHGPAEHMKIFFPLAGEEQPRIPEFGVQTDGQPRSPSRTYTPRYWRPDALELDVDFVLHGDGPGAGWARSAGPSLLATVSTPKGAYVIEPGAARYFIAGDDAALPAIGTILEALPGSSRAEVYVEVENAADEQRLNSRADVSITWLHRGDAEPGSLVDKTIRELRLDEESGRVFVACEASVMRGLRKHLLLDRGLDRSQIFTHGYWKQGESNHPDHDRGEDV